MAVFSSKWVPMFTSHVVDNVISNVVLKERHIDGAKSWLGLIKNHDLDVETQSYPHFMSIMLGNIFGITACNKQAPYFIYEEDFSEFVIKNNLDRGTCCIEAKGMIQNLDKPQAREDKKTPIGQTWRYVTDKEEREFGICTNYRHFVLMAKKSGKHVQHRFDFADIDTNGLAKNTEITVNEKKLKEFVGIFVDGVLDGERITTMRRNAIMEEKDVTNEFYQLYHETRLMLIRSIEKKGIGKRDSYEKAQTILNRLLFMFFVADKKIAPVNVFRDWMRGLLGIHGRFNDTSTRLYDEILDMFSIFKDGSNVNGVVIPKFNGGLFEEELDRGLVLDKAISSEYDDLRGTYSKRKQKLEEIDKELVSLMRQQPNINPVFENLLLMDSYDFTSELTVNILGHVFEQSLADLANMFESEISQRKAEGAYYTPDGMTDHICRNTILSYLSKSGTATDSDDLVIEYDEDIGVLEEKFRTIKILDPSCGSGAFLLKAVDILLEVSLSIRRYKEQHGAYVVEDGQENLDAYNEETEASRIIQNNIYGVDLNPQAVEIARLSIFFKIASDKPLPSLERNIRHGNSLIAPDDEAKIGREILYGRDADVDAFDWQNNFPDVMTDGFDVIIGNPPWDKTKGTKVEFYAPYYDSMHTDKFRLCVESKKRIFIKNLDAERPDVYEKYKRYIETRKTITSFFTKCKSYEFQKGKRGTGDANFYKLFTEKAFKLLKPGGMLGYVIPIGFCLDSSDTMLRKMIIESGKLRHILGFINTNGVFFHDVHKQQKFCVLVAENTATSGDYGIRCRFKIEDVDAFTAFNIVEDSGTFIMPTMVIKLSDAFAIPEIPTSEGMRVFEKMYKHGTIGPMIRARSEVHMTKHKPFFHEIDSTLR